MKKNVTKMNLKQEINKKEEKFKNQYNNNTQ